MNYVDMVVLCENVLGLTHDPDVQLWKARAVQAGILKRKMAQRPSVYTFENLNRVIVMLQRQRQGVETAAGLCFWVDEMLEGLAEDDG
jgi:hypothetical protein